LILLALGRPLLGGPLVVLAGRRRGPRVGWLALLFPLVSTGALLALAAGLEWPARLGVGGWPAQFGIVLVVDLLSALMLTLSSLIALGSLLFGYAEMPVRLDHLGTVLPHSLTFVHTLLAWLAGLTMVLAVMGAISRPFIGGILSFHILSQIGFMALAIGLFTPLSLAACILYIIHHIVVKSSLFLIGGTALRLNGTDDLDHMGNLWRRTPWLGALFLLQALSLAGLPPLSGF
jgi:formate hydrogenlyase subunit 3/multisubunit Na+/H+ antiporter MnhD subunit